MRLPCAGRRALHVQSDVHASLLRHAVVFRSTAAVELSEMMVIPRGRPDQELLIDLLHVPVVQLCTALVP